MGDVTDRAADGADRTIAKHHVEALAMRTTEVVGGFETGLILPGCASRVDVLFIVLGITVGETYHGRVIARAPAYVVQTLAIGVIIGK